MLKAHHPIKIVARRTGLSAHVIRIWEKRYGAVEPERTPTNRRLYSEAQVERLIWLRDLTRNGHGIGHVAKLSNEELQQLAKEAPAEISTVPEVPTGARGAAYFLQKCLASVEALDARKLDESLQEAATKLGALGLLQRVIAPLTEAIGNLWRNGAITAAHEHFASAVIRIFLGQAAKSFGASVDAPRIIVATPAGQIHELGALLAAAAAANLGWDVTYLGASLPAAEIAGAARQTRARAVALSLIYPEDDARLAGELTRLREALPPDVALLVGGRAMAAYQEALQRIGATAIKDLTHLGQSLDDLRKPAKTAAK